MKMKTEDYSDKKVYVYYIKDLPFKDVYAYTFSKKVSKKYEKQRNMNKIYKEKTSFDIMELLRNHISKEVFIMDKESIYRLGLELYTQSISKLLKKCMSLKLTIILYY